MADFKLKISFVLSLIFYCVYAMLQRLFYD